jgi:cell division protein FtsQ
VKEKWQKLLQAEFWFGAGFLLLVIAGLIYAIMQLNSYLEDEQRVPVQQIMLSGQRTQIDDAQIESLVRSRHPGSFFELDVDKVLADVQSLPWVYKASVRKRWPNSLQLHLVEQVPAAHWNNDLLLNQYGESFEAVAPAIVLPSLFGPGGSEQIALEGYKAMQALLNNTQLRVTELFLSERFAWNIRLSNGISLNLGRTEFIDRLQRFIDLYPLLNKDERAVDYVDLRYDTGFAVGWKPGQQVKQES